MRTFEVVPGVVPTWPGMTPAARVVAEFLAKVRVTGDVTAARALMAQDGRVVEYWIQLDRLGLSLQLQDV